MFERKTTLSTIVIATALVSAGSAARADDLNPQPEPPGVARHADPMAAIYNNTVVLTNGQGQTEKLWLSANHTFQWEGPKGQHGKGRWQLTANNTRICLTPIRTRESAKESPATRCAEFIGGHRAGDRWTQLNDANEKVAVEVRKGQ